MDSQLGRWQFACILRAESHPSLWASEGWWLHCPSMLGFTEKVFLKNGYTVTDSVCGVASRIPGERQPVRGNGARQQGSRPACVPFHRETEWLALQPQNTALLRKTNICKFIYRICVELTQTYCDGSCHAAYIKKLYANTWTMYTLLYTPKSTPCVPGARKNSSVPWWIKIESHHSPGPFTVLFSCPVKGTLNG